MSRKVGLALLSLIFVGFATLTHAQTAATCYPGTRAIKDGERERAKLLGIDIPTGTNCLDNRTAQWLDAGIDKDIDYFNQRICTGKKAGLPSGFNANDTSPQNWNQIRKDDGYVYFTAPGNSMNPGVLRCFRQFFEKEEALGYKPCVNSALRSLAHQRASCLAPNSVVCGRSGSGTGSANSCPNTLSSYANCPHVNGLAMDVGDNTGRVAQVLGHAKSFPSFSKVGAGAADPWHVEARGCADPNYKPSLDQKDTWNGSVAGLGATSPTSAFANVLRTALGLGVQQPLYAQPPLPVQQPYAGAQPIAGAFGQPVNPTVINPTVTATPSDTGGSNTSAPGLPDFELPKTTATGTSLADILSGLAYGTATPTVSATSGFPFIPLIIDPNDRSDRVATATQPIASNAATNYAPPSLATTFNPNTLSPTPAAENYNVSFTSYSGFGQILTRIQSVLLAMLEYLRPFANREANPTVYVEGE